VGGVKTSLTRTEDARYKHVHQATSTREGDVFLDGLHSGSYVARFTHKELGTFDASIEIPNNAVEFTYGKRGAIEVVPINKSREGIPVTFRTSWREVGARSWASKYTGGPQGGFSYRLSGLPEGQYEVLLDSSKHCGYAQFIYNPDSASRFLPIEVLRKPIVRGRIKQQADVASVTLIPEGLQGLGLPGNRVLVVNGYWQIHATVVTGRGMLVFADQSGKTTSQIIWNGELEVYH